MTGRESSPSAEIWTFFFFLPSFFFSFPFFPSSLVVNPGSALSLPGDARDGGWDCPLGTPTRSSFFDRDLSQFSTFARDSRLRSNMLDFPSPPLLPPLALAIVSTSSSSSSPPLIDLSSSFSPLPFSAATTAPAKGPSSATSSPSPLSLCLGRRDSIMAAVSSLKDPYPVACFISSDLALLSDSPPLRIAISMSPKGDSSDDTV
mmetsp:Transcript_5160/g.11311  ORF Transcript_5160/g.11311 Transcript_5160/m.11311 type:complete len:204 (+) Transcript_5160:1957-2568(+)